MDSAKYKAMKAKIKDMTDDELYDAILATGMESREEQSYSYALGGEAERRPDGWDGEEGFLSRIYAKRLERALVGVYFVGLGLMSLSNDGLASLGVKITKTVSRAIDTQRFEQLLEEHTELMSEFWGENDEN